MYSCIQRFACKLGVFICCESQVLGRGVIYTYHILIQINMYMGNCQNYGPFLGPYYNTGPNTGLNLGDPKRDHNFDNSHYTDQHVDIYIYIIA